MLRMLSHPWVWEEHLGQGGTLWALRGEIGAKIRADVIIMSCPEHPRVSSVVSGVLDVFIWFSHAFISIFLMR